MYVYTDKIIIGIHVFISMKLSATGWVLKKILVKLLVMLEGFRSDLFTLLGRVGQCKG